jgi:NAD-dependent protein deacetylase/lipoamidase
MPHLDQDKYKNVVFFTGAGMSAESGVPTYRGKGGTWTEYNFEEYACQAAFEKNPEKVWEFHNMRRAAVLACGPHSGHELLVEWEEKFDNFTVVTQNIDGMHQRAGSTVVHELHGSLWRVVCQKTGRVKDNHEVPLSDLRSEYGYWRPDIVWFGDTLDPVVIYRSLEAISQCDLLISIGTSGVVFPAAQFPLQAKEVGATLVEVNPEETSLSGQYDLCLRGPASRVLAELF